MSERLPRVSGKELVAALLRGGYATIRQRGSHVQLRHPTRDGLVTVPVHGNEVLDAKVVKSILTQAGLTVDELKELL
jgi:predicted RNA binding protein YcfA (HicA-like mRNA interferase family)